MTTLSQSDIKTLEQTRQRLSQLTHSLASLQQNILQSEILPPWTSLQSLASVISQNLTSVSTHLSTHSQLLASLAVFPLPNYPGKTQEALLGQLLRKKLEPGVEDWVAKGRETADQRAGEEQQRPEMLELWSWAGMAANELARSHEWGGDFTVEEIEGGVENLVTGLRRKLGAEEDEDEDDEMGGVDAKEKRSSEATGDPVPLDQVLKFMMKGPESKG